MQKKYKVLLIILLSILLLAVVIFIGFKLYDKDDTPQVKHVDNIEEYGYSLEERDTKLMKDVFSSLKKELSKDEVNYEKYAEYLSELYIIDLFTINNKNNKYDIPSLEYILESSKENFSLNVEDTLYKYVEENSDGSRKQELPEVKSIMMTKIEESDYTISEVKYEGYKVTLKWDYKKDYGYDVSGVVTLIRSDNKLYVVNYESTSEVTDEKSN